MAQELLEEICLRHIELVAFHVDVRRQRNFYSCVTLAARYSFFLTLNLAVDFFKSADEPLFFWLHFIFLLVMGNIVDSSSVTVTSDRAIAGGVRDCAGN